MTFRGRVTSSIAVVLMAAALAACDVVGLSSHGWVWPEPAPLPDGATPVAIELAPKFDIPDGSDGVACTQALLGPVEVHYVAGDSAQPIHYRRVVGGDEVVLQWQPGFTAWLHPDLQIVAPDGMVIAHDGDVLDQLGGSGTEPCFPAYLPRRAGS